MKITCKYVAFLVMSFMLVFAHQVSASSLGDRLADQLCYGMSITYSLSTAELAEWSGQDVSGEKAVFKGGDKYISTFYKSRNKDANATCKMKSIVSGVSSCKQAGVTKSLNILTRTGWGTVSCP